MKSQGYKTSDIYDQGSFDIVARKNLLILLLKTFQNIDSINESNAHEMKQLANIFLASPIIIGEKLASHATKTPVNPKEPQVLAEIE